MSGFIGFFSRRWRGEVPLSRVFWRDMLGVGTFINLLLSVVALILAARGLDLWMAVALHFSPMPYNLFLCMSIWRSPRRTAWMSTCAFIWLALMTVA
jgi:hypothetical protein